MATCLPWLREQIGLVKPKVIVALGATATEGLLGETRALRDLRGKWLDFNGTPVMVTYHPAYLLRNQSITEKRKVWEDMLLVLNKLGRTITPKQQKYFTLTAE
jgi:uracil-DNA glycosylase family 4